MTSAGSRIQFRIVALRAEIDMSRTVDRTMRHGTTAKGIHAPVASNASMIRLASVDSVDMAACVINWARS